MYAVLVRCACVISLSLSLHVSIHMRVGLCIRVYDLRTTHRRFRSCVPRLHSMSYTAYGNTCARVRPATSLFDDIMAPSTTQKCIPQLHDVVSAITHHMRSLWLMALVRVRRSVDLTVCHRAAPSDAGRRGRPLRGDPPNSSSNVDDITQSHITNTAYTTRRCVKQICEYF